MRKIGFTASEEPDGNSDATVHGDGSSNNACLWGLHITGDDRGFTVEIEPHRPARIVKELAFLLASNSGLREMLGDAVKFSMILASAEEECRE